ncbi:MAG: GNAT family protein [Clostridia bacterium]|nr:GNAT family protein [Clostridia bacterium]
MILFNRRKKEAAPTLPVLHTQRLVLRAFDANDAVDVYAIGQSENVARMAGFARHQTLEDSRRMVRELMNAHWVWAIVEKRTGHVIGLISLQADGARSRVNALKLGYTLGEASWGQGYATEACREIIRHAFEERGCEVLSVSHFPFNAKSRHVIKKLGFACEGLLRCAHGLPDGTACDLMCYSLLKSEYEARKLDK